MSPSLSARPPGLFTLPHFAVTALIIRTRRTDHYHPRHATAQCQWRRRWSESEWANLQTKRGGRLTMAACQRFSRDVSRIGRRLAFFWALHFLPNELPNDKLCTCERARASGGDEGGENGEDGPDECQRRATKMTDAAPPEMSPRPENYSDPTTDTTVTSTHLFIFYCASHES